MSKKLSDADKKRSTSIALSPQTQKIAELILQAEIRPNLSNLFEYLIIKHARENGYIKNFKTSDNTNTQQ